MFEIVWNLVNSFGKDRGEVLLNQNNKQTLQQKRCLHTGGGRREQDMSLRNTDVPGDNKVKIEQNV